MSTSNKRSASDAGLPEADNSPCCWICLEEGPDKAGESLVRDCSCRGSSGFAHLSCIVEYAKSEGRRIVDTAETYTAGSSFIKAFKYCPNCKQQYQNDVIYKLTKAAVDFTDREYKDVDCGYLLRHTLLNRLNALDPKNNADDKAEGEESCTKILSIIDQMKSNNDTAQEWEEICVYGEAGAYGSMSGFYMRADTTESLAKAKLYMERARDIYRGIEDDDEFQMSMLSFAEQKIAAIESKISGVENLCVDTLRKSYDDSQRMIGESSPITINDGAKLAEALFLSFHTIEGERLLSKLVELSRRVHGSAHQCTKRTLTILLRAKQRHVKIQENDKPFIALRYENDGGMCIVKDPTIDDEKVVQLSSSAIIPYLGTPVICEGLQQMTHLNGKIGDVRKVDIGTRTCEVHFEEEGLEHAEIDSNNLRIVFDLPSLGAEWQRASQMLE